MARLVKEMGTGPMGRDSGASTQVTAVITAINARVFVVIFCFPETGGYFAASGLKLSLSETIRLKRRRPSSVPLLSLM